MPYLDYKRMSKFRRHDIEDETINATKKRRKSVTIMEPEASLPDNASGADCHR